MRKTRLEIRERKVRGQDKWEVTVPQRGGGRSRRYFTSKKEAQGFLAIARVQVENYGLEGLSMDERLRVDCFFRSAIFNTASLFHASVSGGQRNTASGGESSVSGGASNTAGGSGTVVIGGVNIINNKDFSIAPQPPFP
jgi:hypothetical protein